MIKKLLILISMVVLFSCGGSIDTNISKKKINYRKICLDGVVYYNSTKQLAPAFNVDGTLRLCKE